MNSNTIKVWLKKIGKDRFWLAEKCKVEKVTVDGWITRNNIPSKAIVIIEKLMSDHNEKNPDKLSNQEITLDFNDAEWSIVEQFLKNNPGINLASYLKNKAIEFSLGMEAKSTSKQPSTITYPNETNTVSALRVAENDNKA